MKIAITGATGFLGQSLAKYFHGKGNELYLHARSADKSKVIEDLASRLIICDINDEQGIKNLVEDADIVIHTVSNFRSASGPPESYREINLEGTKNVFQKSKNCGVKKFVYISTIGVLGDIRECPASETTPYNPGDEYQRTKLEAELYCRDQVEKDSKMDLVVIRPCSMYGPGDMRMLKMFRMLKKGTFLAIGNCKANFHAVYIDDLVKGIELAMNDEKSHGEVYILGGDSYISLKEYISIAADSVGSKFPWIRLPFWPMYVLSAVVEFICVPLRIEPPIFRRRIKFYRNDRAFNISKAKLKLNYSPVVSLKEGMKNTVAWYKDNGFL